MTTRLVSMDKIAIKQLYEVPQHFDTVANWIYEQWWKKPGNTIEVVKQPLREHLEKKDFPLTLVALEGEKPAGSVLLIENDGISELPDLTPWLAALYVAPRFRRQGVGPQLVQALEQHARQIGYKKLYLVATDRVSFYKDLSWGIYTKMGGKTGITIMHKQL
ncbi:GNAT family N-acetyltransferase [Pontibacter oryzae]|uniref:GNAT family N-acetyltransferase n=1 Tax=Pontibacter oryzae TaxID=2304593 RepID=A0A399RY94_9BACT|nr:GNAT family N-acetyltransferase [Pontibacter oryzae]RIJ36736.1 GNAT family N-acetyltransferase [Pontibacter oryzae]